MYEQYVGRPLSKEKGDREDEACWGLRIAILPHERGIPSTRKSATCMDYVPALCTHRPSLLPMEWISELWGFSTALGLCWRTTTNLLI
jgi:hypothetical protein